uniref:Trafficking protein particle complex 6B n=1 Tax=Plectus sambesii TaxID=2011161 RepID=A0A914XAJ4_9BILA
MNAELPFELLHSELVACMFAREQETSSTEEANATAGQDESFLETTNAATKLELLGYRVGYALVERIAKELPRISTELDCMKFICKEFWSAIFRKQVDNLRTNHQGVYVVMDNKFFLLVPLSAGQQYLTASPRYVAFSCGLIRGALANLNIQSVVTATVETMPAVKFNVHVQQKS